MSTDRGSTMIFDKAWYVCGEKIQQERDAAYDRKKVSELTVGELRAIIRREIGKAKEDK